MSRMQHQKLIFTLCLLCFSSLPLILGDSIYFEDCVDTPSRGTIFDVQMDGCSSTGMDDPCLVNHGETARGVLVFESAADVETLTCQIFGIIGGLPLPFPGGCPNTDACADLDGSEGAICPIRRGQQFTYRIAMEIMDTYPAVEVIGKWTLKDEQDEVLVCFQVPIQITQN